jgi:hypothetical protein
MPIPAKLTIKEPVSIIFAVPSDRIDSLKEEIDGSEH